MSSLPTQVEVKWMRDGDNLGCYACGKLNAGHQHVFARCIRAYADKIADREARAAYWVERHTAHAKGEAFTKPYLRPPPPHLTKEEAAALVLQRTAERSITVETKKVAGEKRKIRQSDAFFAADGPLMFEEVYRIHDILPPTAKKNEEPPVEPPTAKKNEEPPEEPPKAKEDEDPAVESPVEPPTTKKDEDPPEEPPKAKEDEDPAVQPPTAKKDEELPEEPPKAKEDEEPAVEPPTEKKDEDPPVEPPTAKAPTAKAPMAKAPMAKAKKAKAKKAKAAPKEKETEVATTTRPKRTTAGNIYKENVLNIIGRSYKKRGGSAQ
jgi:hypothetical protein